MARPPDFAQPVAAAAAQSYALEPTRSLTSDQIILATVQFEEQILGRPLTAAEEQHIRGQYYRHKLPALTQQAFALLEECHTVPSILPRNMDDRICQVLREARRIGLLPREE